MKAGYCDYDDGNINRRGQIFPFTGIRGDAKALYEVCYDRPKLCAPAMLTWNIIWTSRWGPLH